MKPGEKIAHVQIGVPPRLRGVRNIFPWFLRRWAYAPFAEALSNRIAFRAFYSSSRPTPDETRRLVEKLSGYDAVVVSLQGMTRRAADGYGLSPEGLNLLARIRASGKPTALVVFGNPYSLALTGPQTAVLVAYEDDPEAQVGAAEVVSGALKAEGRLPVTSSQDFPEGSGL